MRNPVTVRDLETGEVLRTVPQIAITHPGVMKPKHKKRNRSSTQARMAAKKRAHLERMEREPVFRDGRVPNFEDWD